MDECVVCGNKTHKLLNEMCMSCHEPEEIIADVEMVSTSVKRMRDTIDSQSLTIRQMAEEIRVLREHIGSELHLRYLYDVAVETIDDINEEIEAAKGKIK